MLQLEGESQHSEDHCGGMVGGNGTQATTHSGWSLNPEPGQLPAELHCTVVAAESCAARQWQLVGCTALILILTLALTLTLTQ